MKRISNDRLAYDEESGGFLLDGEPFTGVGFSLYPDGSVRSEIAYRDGFFDGASKKWSADGILTGEQHFRRGAAHGEARKWRESGQLAEEGHYEYGIPISIKTWDADGAVTKDFKLTETNPNYQSLLRARQLESSQTGGDPE
jgi:antitoxin component YwqK of YwqJK toxin-antitoxin module